MELILNRSHRSVDVRIVGGDDEHVWTTVPNKDGEFIRFLSNEDFVLLSYNKDSVYRFNIRFEDMKQSGDHLFYSYKIKNLQILDNVRKNIRTPVELPASLYDGGIVRSKFGTILDMSYKGMRVESNFPIDSSILEIDFNDSGVLKTAKGTVVWSKQEGDKFHYGVDLHWIIC